MIEPSQDEVISPSAQPPSEQSFGLMRFLLCFVAFGVVASLARNVSANLIVPVLVGGAGCALLVISIRRRHWPLIVSLGRYSSIGLLMGALSCQSSGDVAIEWIAAITSTVIAGALAVLGLMVTVGARANMPSIFFRTLCAMIGAVVVICLTPSAFVSHATVLLAGLIGSLAGWGLACLPAEAIKVERSLMPQELP